MGKPKNLDRLAWLNEFRRALLTELMRSTNRSLDGLDGIFGQKLKRTDNWHLGWLMRCCLIVNLQDVCAADEKAQILEIGNRVALELDNEVVLHFWKHDPSANQGSTDPLHEAAKAYEANLRGQASDGNPPTIHIQLALKGFGVEPQQIRVPELISSIRHIGVEYISRRNRLASFRISAKDENGQTVTETIVLNSTERSPDDVDPPPLPDIKLKEDRRDEDEDAQ